ncbi:YmfL family putative regulatory protein [Escherichia coli]
MGKHHWKVEKQPEWYVKAVRKTIAALPGGYAEAADWLDVTENALFNRLRADGDQIFPLGWAMILQRAGGTHFIADAVAQSANGVFVSLPDVEDVDNADINQRLLEVIEQIGSYSKQIRSAIEDGVWNRMRRQQLTTSCTSQFRSCRSMQHWSTKFFAFQKVMTPASVQLRAPWRVVTVEKLTHEQFNNTLPSLATDCASCTGWKSEGGVLLCS